MTSDSVGADKAAYVSLPEIGDASCRTPEAGNAGPSDKPGPIGYYMLHSCSDSADHQDQCDAVFVWASSPEEALSLDPEKHRDADTVEVKRQEKTDAFRPVLGPRWGNGWGNGERLGFEERAYRAAGFHEDSGTTCDTCGLGEFSKAPESKVCRECLQCAECGCGCSEQVDEAVAAARKKAFEEAAALCLSSDWRVLPSTINRTWDAAREACAELILAYAKEGPARG